METRLTDTKQQLQVFTWLQNGGYHVRLEEKVGRYSIDVYLPELKLGIELDGFTHSRKKDKKRDDFILDRYNIPILRYKNKQIDRMTEEEFIEEIDSYV